MNIISRITQVNLFERGPGNTPWDRWATGTFVGHPFYLDYACARLLVADAWKQRAHGIPQGCFLLAYYDHEVTDGNAAEAVLLRVLRPTTLPTDQEVIASMVEYYKDGIRTGETSTSQLDTYTRYEFSFGGLECAVLGSFYRNQPGAISFGADLENFYSAHNYSVVKPNARVLTRIVNYREGSVPGGPGDIQIGRVRYSSSRRFQSREEGVPVYVHAPDFAGKRTALFGMTRTGKSNTLKKIIQANADMSARAPRRLDGDPEPPEEILAPFTSGGDPKYPIGQIIFDINGEYANPNLQDQGTAIFDLYQDGTIRYSTVPKPGFRELKVNFYRDIETGFELIKSHPNISTDGSRFVTNFRTVDLSPPEDPDDRSALTRYQRRVAVYCACLHQAGFQAASNFTVSFSANEGVRDAVGVSTTRVSRGLVTATLDEAVNWWSTFWEIYDADPSGCFDKYKRDNDHEWADDDLKALLTILTRRTRSGRGVDCNGFRILRPVRDQHTAVEQRSFEDDVLENLRAGRIVIIDLSIGDPAVQALFSERICRHVFQDALRRFTANQPNNFVQFYFEEAHNLFPRKDDKDLSQIYNRLAKEGAKLHLGLVYATQEVSSISSNILKNTQNWFVSHLNNEDELREIRKYYDFADFAHGLLRFSQDTDKGFARMKSYSSPFIIPIQVDRFPPEEAMAEPAA